MVSDHLVNLPQVLHRCQQIFKEPESEPKKIIIHALKLRHHLYAELNILSENVAFSMRLTLFKFNIAINIEAFQLSTLYTDLLDFIKNGEKQQLAREKEIEEAEKMNSRSLQLKGVYTALKMIGVSALKRARCALIFVSKKYSFGE